MSSRSTLVSLGLPVRNGETRIAQVVASVLAQDHDNIELVISDNASDDGTEEICRSLARSDRRVSYHRQAENIGLNRNFAAVVGLSTGEYFRWVSDDDWLAPSYVSRCLVAFTEDPRFVRVTTQMSYELGDGTVGSARYQGDGLRSDDPIDRFAEMLRLQNESYLLLDPVYGLNRRELVATMKRPDLFREDEVFAARTALAGPWGHIPEVLAGRSWFFQPLPRMAARLDLPAWQAKAATALQCRALLAALHEFELTPAQRRRGRLAVGRFYLRRWRRWAQRGGRKLAALRPTSRRSPAT
ncbi:MAG: glycosyltransferase family 2 protein [Pseudonocardiaceae bacterium]